MKKIIYVIAIMLSFSAAAENNKKPYVESKIDNKPIEFKPFSSNVSVAVIAAPDEIEQVSSIIRGDMPVPDNPTIKLLPIKPVN